jgi:hypothetical protein
MPSREELQTVLENWQQRVGRTERGGKRNGRRITVKDYVRVRPISQEDERELRELEEACEARRQRTKELARESRKFREKYQKEEGEKIFFIHSRRVSYPEWRDWQFKKKELEKERMIRESLEKQIIRTQRRLEEERLKKERVEQA